jgi:nucleoid-associated protein YgaU
MTFFKGSRYATVGEVVSTDPEGRAIRYKRTRFIDDSPLQGTHVVTDGDRLDRLAFRVYGDVSYWWVIADANDAMCPDDLVSEPGQVIGMPSGQP